MWRADQLFLHGKQVKELDVIKGVTFTPREIDIISCLAHMRGPSKISSLLSISSHTVTAHTRNLMLKIGCNSREGIIDFIEHSLSRPLINQHYAHLAIQGGFEKSLKDIAQIKRKPKQVHVFFYGNSQPDRRILAQLEQHLKQAGIDAITEHISNATEVIDGLRNYAQVLLIFLEKGEQEKIPKELQVFDFLNGSEYKSYYLFVFEILKKLLYPINITSYTQNFHDQYTNMTDVLMNEIPQFPNIKPRKGVLYKKIQVFKNKTWLSLFTISCFVLTFYAFYIFKENVKMPITQSQEQEKQQEKNQQEASIRSDLPLPISSVFLERPEEIAQIEQKLKGEKGIQTIALVGPGGIGKTILSRYYAHQQKANIIWELNAETPETLKSSFEDLATALAQTEKNQKFLIGLQDIKNPKERAKKLVSFVKQHLKLHAPWLLIFDNVETFQDIQSYFPQDAATWGQGKILLTTRNSNIQNNKYVKDTFQLQELNPTQKLALFTKIITQGSEKPLTRTQRDEAKQFLEKIPSYPLDVSMAAYYLKITNISYDLFLKELSKNNKMFANVQEKILKEAGDYIKTRYGIITLSFQHLINSHKEFSNLLLFICLLDSQHIPRSLLGSYQKDIHLVDAFIFDLKKYSLIINDSLPSIAPSFPLNITFSMHRSTQEIGLAYLIKVLRLEKIAPSFKELPKILRLT